MHWFKIVLLVLLALGVMLNLYESGRGNYQKESKGWASFLGAILNGLLLWGILAYL